MSVLAPLYFLGALAIGLPILFHLIRRQPRGQVQFSSLMFLQQTPPRLTRRSRLDNWLLLLIRALALLLLILAFMRPFLRSSVNSESDVARRLVIAIDTSASMQRDGLWQQAIDQAHEVIDDLAAGDELAIVAFDRKPKVILSFEQSDDLDNEQIVATAKAALAELQPSWFATDIGRATALAADLAASHESSGSAEGDDSPEKYLGSASVILISDMQSGAKIESLQTYAWPKGLSLDVRHLKAQQRTNAFAKVLVQTNSNSSDDETGESESARDKVRVRVESSSDSLETKFRVGWAKADGSESFGLPVHVPPGSSRVIRLPIPDATIQSLAVSGDQVSFDNTNYIVSPQPEAKQLLYLGEPISTDTQKQREHLFHYLKNIPLNNARRVVTTSLSQTFKASDSLNPDSTPLVVVGDKLDSDVADSLKEYVASGGQVLFVLGTPQQSELATAIQRVTDSKLSITEAKVKDYAMLSGIDFKHPVFGSMSDPQFNDFTKIRFWAHRTLTELEDDFQVLASFDDGDPALVEKHIGNGKAWILATGWQPLQSQLALSSKFIPLMYAFFDAASLSANVASNDFQIGEDITLKVADDSKLMLPDGQQVAVESQAELTSLIDQPGVYSLLSNNKVRTFAVNLGHAESRTGQLDDGALERFGIGLQKTLSAAELAASNRQLRDVELEKRQRIWQWLLVVALVLLGLETLLGGRLSRSTAASPEIIS